MHFSTIAVSSAIVAAAVAMPAMGTASGAPTRTGTGPIATGTGSPQPVNATEWTLEDFKRACTPAAADGTDASGSCMYSFGINTNPDAAPAPSAVPLAPFAKRHVRSGASGANSTFPCSYSINGTNPERQSYGGVVCGPDGRFHISSSWSGQFGPDQGFSAMAIVDKVNNVIVYPAYTDQQLANGTAVKPDISFQIQSFAGLAQ